MASIYLEVMVLFDIRVFRVLRFSVDERSWGKEPVRHSDCIGRGSTVKPHNSISSR